MNDTTIWAIAAPVIATAFGWIIKQNYQINKKIDGQNKDINKKIVKVFKKVFQMGNKKVSHKVCLKRMAACQCVLNNDDAKNKKQKVK